jgi:hypothetical protein
VVTRAGAQGPDTVIRTDPSTIQISPGEVVTLSVVLAGAQEVYGIDVRAAFDPQLVEVVDVDPDREGVQFSPGTFPQPDFVVRRDADNEAGTLRYVITQVSPTEPATGDGVVFTVQLRALADSGEGAFTLGPIEMADSAGTLLGVQPESGLIRITPGGQVPTDQPAAVVSAAGDATATAVAAAAGDTQPAQASSQPATVAPSADANQAATPSATAPETPAAAESSLPLLAVLALVAIVVVVIVVMARRRPAS